MERFQKDMIGIVKAALLNEKYTLPEDFDFDSALKLAKKHGIIVMFYYGLLNCGVDESLPIMQQLFMITCQNVAVSERQMYAVREILAEFDKANIDYMPLKGTLLKSLYRKPEMRSMGDADILIKTEQHPEIEPIMSGLGFTPVVESNHEFIWKKPGVNIELHKRLIPSYNKDYYAYFGDGWRLAKVKEGTRYSMTDEDQMIYLFTHYAKHYRDAGIGIRHIVDLWVYRKNKPFLDEEYIKKELERLKLFDFYTNTNKTLAVWFEGKEEDGVSDFITRIIFNSGVYGTREAKILSEAVKLSKSHGSAENVQKSKYIRLIFPKFTDMSQKYTVLKKAPYLLPFFWVGRIFSVLLFKRDKIKYHQENVNKMNQENIDSYQNALNYVGLDFNFKE